MRLKEERKQWRKEHRWGFYARETLNEDGSKNIFKWEAGIPGKEKVLTHNNRSKAPLAGANALARRSTTAWCGDVGGAAASMCPHC